ncbi:CHAT domain-containing protein [Streptomyces sp. NPDC006134]|uniref:CHAT domain-containing protein n=1 Tax=Streptomyces sp. NPDC006134 TaxID=3154467 RepID=UPI003408B284
MSPSCCARGVRPRAARSSWSTCCSPTTSTSSSSRRAAPTHVRVATSRVGRTRLARFAAANFGSVSRVRELATGLEDLFHHEFSEVVAPFADLCEPGDTLVVCPAGPVHDIPLGAVRLGQDMFLARNPLVISPSASPLGSRGPLEERSGGRDRAVFGDPTGDLDGARREARELGQERGVPAGLGERAAAHALLDSLSSAGTVRVAAHASFRPGDPPASGIRMADRVVTAREILGIRTAHLGLVTLSACESGLYHAGRSEGLPGTAARPAVRGGPLRARQPVEGPGQVGVPRHDAVLRRPRQR